ncbi:MAG: cell division protein [Legionellales bacterium RIFCSPHIGHO2_12_FULL_42_9]|nr:MAG: cell division protein [Legionellales bacterium RIFCSPHIGHO2_12_FULL_42_9]
MKSNGHKARLFFLSAIFIVMWVVLIWRVLDLTILNRQFLKGQGDARSLRTMDMPAYRGMITDREGAPLAVSTTVQSVWINPKDFKPTSQQLTTLSQLLESPKKELVYKITHANQREFVYLKRQLPPEIAAKITNLKLPGLYLQQEFKRYYPEGENTAQLLGFTNIDDNGIEGLELAYQDWLMGVPGQQRVLKDRTGRIIESLGVLKEPHAGHDLVLSIDRRIQYIAYHELQNTLEQFHAKAGSVIVVDTETGEILAAANAPAFNPNARDDYTRDSYRNKAFTDTFEPGSVTKAFSIASALESKQVTPTTVIDTRPGWMIVHGRTIRDVHQYGVLDVTGVLERSSNVGVTKITLLSPPEQLIGLLHRAGFGQRTESGYPGESEGTIVKVKDANPFVLATVSFGYGISVSAIQLAQAYMVFANGGVLRPVTLIHNQPVTPGMQVLSTETSDEILSMLESVCNAGTGKAAQVPGYRVAGKTGTARIAGKQGYDERRYIGSFVGIAPVSKPKLVVVVVIHEPTHNGYYGAAVAAPLFKKVMSASLRILDIMPDRTI